jgi:hypothetical protein
MLKWDLFLFLSGFARSENEKGGNFLLRFVY